MIKLLAKIAILFVIGAFVFMCSKKYLHKEATAVKIQQNIHWL